MSERKDCWLRRADGFESNVNVQENKDLISKYLTDCDYRSGLYTCTFTESKQVIELDFKHPKQAIWDEFLNKFKI